MKVTARNLRIRENMAKYLRNLDLNSAYYDPKSRSMRDNPYPEHRTTETEKKILDIYGGSEYLDGSSGLADSSLNLADNGDGNPVGVSFRQDRKVRLGAAFCMEEYTRDGRYFHKGAFRWGFADDHSLIRNSYYTGVTRRAANDEANALQCGDG